MKHSVAHHTVKLEKKIGFPVERVYSAFARVQARAVWGVPQGDAIEYSEADFSVGGRDVFRCGSPTRMEYRGVVQYQDLVKNKRIISTETISHGKKRISVALLTFELMEAPGGTRILLTAQISSLDGADMSQGYKQGWTAVLGNLDGFLKNSSKSRAPSSSRHKGNR